jgi:hypothetical protein
MIVIVINSSSSVGGDGLYRVLDNRSHCSKYKAFVYTELSVGLLFVIRSSIGRSFLRHSKKREIKHNHKNRKEQNVSVWLFKQRIKRWLFRWKRCYETKRIKIRILSKSLIAFLFHEAFLLFLSTVVEWVHVLYLEKKP